MTYIRNNLYQQVSIECAAALINRFGNQRNWEAVGLKCIATAVKFFDTLVGWWYDDFNFRAIHRD